MKKKIENILILAIAAIMEAMGWIAFFVGAMNLNPAECDVSGLVGGVLGLSGIIFVILILTTYRRPHFD